MSRVRLLACSAVIAFILFGSLYDIARFREHYPFSHYYMFSTIQSDMSVRQYKAVAHPSDGKEQFFISDLQQMRPWLPQRLSLALESAERDPHFSHTAEDLAKTLWTTYEDGRVKGLHSGPPISKITIAKVTWTVLSDASNKYRPDSVQDIASFSAEEHRGRSH